MGTGRFLSYNSQSTPTVRSVAVSTGFGSTGTWTFSKLNPNNHIILSHYQPASETPFEWRFTGRLIVCQRWYALNRGQRFLNI